MAKVEYRFGGRDKINAKWWKIEARNLVLVAGHEPCDSWITYRMYPSKHEAQEALTELTASAFVNEHVHVTFVR